VKINVFVFACLFSCSIHAYCNASKANTVEHFNLSVQTTAGNFRCLIDEEPIGAVLSSDGEAVIVSGTSYVLIDELRHCTVNIPVHVRRAAPHVGFLSDINIKAGIYASMVPVGVSPLSFVAVVAKLGSDKSLIQKPGFYRTSVSESKLEEEASSDMKLIISLDGQYISVDRGQCGSDDKVDIIEIKTGKSIVIDNKTCGQMFNWDAK
jgi:hypothetical protein